jgi:hypothetical protein
VAVAFLNLDHPFADSKLQADERIARVLCCQHLQEVLSVLPSLVADDLADLRLDRVAPLKAERSRELLRERFGALLEGATEPLIELPEPCLQLAADIVDVHRRFLAVEHPRTDLDRLTDGVGGRLAELLTLAHEVSGALVVDRQGLDHDPPVERADRLVHGLADL